MTRPLLGRMYEESVPTAEALPLVWDDPYAFLDTEPYVLSPSGTVWAHRLDRSPACLLPAVAELRVRLVHAPAAYPSSLLREARRLAASPYYLTQMVSAADVFPGFRPGIGIRLVRPPSLLR
jgi:hypothetical protein